MMDPESGRYFEDYTVGVEQEVGSLGISEAEIIEFAKKYDPQDFHTDPEKAVSGPFGGSDCQRLAHHIGCHASAGR